eukprot:1101073-Pyramimonas_sp.AAC.1
MCLSCPASVNDAHLIRCVPTPSSPGANVQDKAELIAGHALEEHAFARSCAFVICDRPILLSA